MFKVNSAYYSDGYKVGHKRMLAPLTSHLYGTWIPRSLKHAPVGIKRIMSAGQQLSMRWIDDEWKENFFKAPIEDAIQFITDMSMYLGMKYDGNHFIALHKLGYLPIKVKSLPEGIETLPNIPHMTFVNTHEDYAWLTLYLETLISALAWKPCTSATIARQYRRNTNEWVAKTDSERMFLAEWMCHDFSARGLDPWTMVSSGLGHAMSNKGSDTLVVIPAARYFYDEPKTETVIGSVNASEHSVSTTKIFTVGERQMIIDWLKEFPVGILSIVADTFDLWKLLLEYIADPEVKALIMARDGKLVIRPDSGDPVDIICGLENKEYYHLINNNTKLRSNDSGISKKVSQAEVKGVIEILWDIFGGDASKEGFKRLDSHIGAIYGDSITLERQIAIYERLAAKGFAATNIVLGVGSFTYQFNTRDTFGFAAKGAWFICDGNEYDIYKDPITDDGTKKSLRGRIAVLQDESGEYYAKQKCTAEEEESGLLQVIYEDGVFFNQTSIQEIRKSI